MRLIEPLLLLTGETASGKSELAVTLAERLDAEIIGADSRQIYREMPIGTAAPTPEQCLRVPHHLVSWLDPYTSYSAAMYVEDALQAIHAIHARGKRVIVVGGTGFYIRALCGDIDLGPEVDGQARARVQREVALHDGEFLHEWLSLRNPQRASEIASTDRYRITRALETMLAGSQTQAKRIHPSLRLYQIPYRKIWIQTEREELARRIECRVDHMLSNGFVEEAERIGVHAPAASAVGYPQAFAYLAGQMTLAELRAMMVRATKRYAKRQATWLRSEPDLTIIPPCADRVAAVMQLLS